MKKKDTLIGVFFLFKKTRMNDKRIWQEVYFIELKKNRRKSTVFIWVE